MKKINSLLITAGILAFSLSTSASAAQYYVCKESPEESIQDNMEEDAPEAINESATPSAMWVCNLAEAKPTPKEDEIAYECEGDLGLPEDDEGIAMLAIEQLEPFFCNKIVDEAAEEAAEAEAAEAEAAEETAEAEEAEAEAAA